MKTINNKAFKECKNLQVIELNEELETIGDSVFEGLSQVRSITIYSNLNSINFLSIYSFSIGSANICGNSFPSFSTIFSVFKIK